MKFTTKYGNTHKYPENLIKDKQKIEAKLLSCIPQDITLIQELPNRIDSDYFFNEDSRVYWSVYKTLYDKNYKHIDRVSIESEFPHGNPTRDLFEQYDGIQMTNRFKKGHDTDISNFDKYKNDFLEQNGKLDLYKSGVEFLEDMRMEELTNQATAEQLYSVADYKLSNSISGMTDDDDIFQLTITDKFLQDCKNGLAVGIEYGMFLMSNLTMGMHKSNFSIMGGFTNFGKSSLSMVAYVYKIALQKKNVFIYSNETSKEDMMTGLTTYILSTMIKGHHNSVTKKKLKSGKFSDEDYMLMKTEAKRIAEEQFMPYITVKRPKRHSSKDFILSMRRYAYRGYEYFLYDTMKADSRGSDNVAGLMVDQSIAIYENCIKLDVHCLATAQLASRHKENGVRILSETHLAGSKQIAEVADIVMCGRDFYFDEYGGEKREIKPFKRVLIDGSWKNEEVKLKKLGEANYVVIFLPKNRYGEKERAIVYEKIGHLGLFKEIGEAIIRE